MEQDPEFDRLMTWFIQNRREIAAAANVQRIALATEDTFDEVKRPDADYCYICTDRGGDIHLLRDAKRVFEKFQPKPLPVLTTIRSDRRVGPNDRCPCGSGKKHKKCCMNKGG